jgi:hypothetical protein
MMHIRGERRNSYKVLAGKPGIKTAQGIPRHMR